MTVLKSLVSADWQMICCTIECTGTIFSYFSFYFNTLSFSFWAKILLWQSQFTHTHFHSFSSLTQLALKVLVEWVEPMMVRSLSLHQINRPSVCPQFDRSADGPIQLQCCSVQLLNAQEMLAECVCVPCDRASDCKATDGADWLLPDDRRQWGDSRLTTTATTEAQQQQQRQ